MSGTTIEAVTELLENTTFSIETIPITAMIDAKVPRLEMPPRSLTESQRAAPLE